MCRYLRLPVTGEYRYMSILNSSLKLNPGSIYIGIPPTKTSVEDSDFELEDSSKALVKGGFHYGRTRNGRVYTPPRPLMNHGPHRCERNLLTICCRNDN